jgi:hypothetical protein
VGLVMLLVVCSSYWLFVHLWYFLGVCTGAAQLLLVVLADTIGRSPLSVIYNGAFLLKVSLSTYS